MKLPAAKFAVFAILSFAASITVILSQRPSELGKRAQPLSSAAERPAFERVLLRTTAKRRIARDVIAGRLPLGKAAALFDALNRVPPQWQSGNYRFRFPRDTDVELLYRQVLGYVSCELDEKPDCREAAMPHLEADYLLAPEPIEKLLTQARQELTDQGIRRLKNEENASGTFTAW